MNEFSVERCLLDPAVFAENRLPAHSDHLAFRSEEELAAGESSLRLCLDGVWKFHYANNLSVYGDKGSFTTAATYDAEIMGKKVLFGEMFGGKD